MKQKDLLFIFISITIVVIAWIVFGVIHNSVTSTIPQSTAVDIKPINGSFDTKTIKSLKSRVKINPQTNIAISPTPTPTVAPITPIPSIQSFTFPIASQGGK